MRGPSWNLVVAMYGHYVDLFRCHSSMAGHRIVLAYNCLEVAAKLGRYHRAVRRRQPGEELPDWIPTLEIPVGDSRLQYVDAFTLLGDAMHPAYGHPKMLAQAYDQVYYEGWEMGNLPLRGKKTADQSARRYTGRNMPKSYTAFLPSKGLIVKNLLGHCLHPWFVRR